MPASKRRSRGLPAFVWIIGLLITALVASLTIKSCDDTDESNSKETLRVEKVTNKPIGTRGLKPKDIAVTGQKVPANVSATKSTATPYPSPDELTNALTPVYEIGPRASSKLR